MKKLFILFVAILAMTIVCLPKYASAQAPQMMSYQAVIRDGSKQLVTNQTVTMKISILQGSATGDVIYTETQKPTTNSNGLVSIEIGGGAGFTNINWGNGPFFIKTRATLPGNTGNPIIGKSQLLSVPFALYAEHSGDTCQWEKNFDDIYYLKGGVGIGTTTPLEKLQVNGIIRATSNGYNWSSGPGINMDYYASLSLGRIQVMSDNDGTVQVASLALNPGGGRVGIGTSYPTTDLDVNGSVAVSGSMIVNGALVVNGAYSSNFQGFSYYTTGTQVGQHWSTLIIPTLDYNTFPGTTYNTETGEFSAPLDGFYRFTLTGWCITGTIGPDVRYAMGIYINGIIKSFSGGNYSTEDSPLCTYSQVVHLNAGDIVTAAYMTPMDVTLGYAIEVAPGHQFFFQGEFVGK